jgi:hypothetical protein
MFIPLLPNVASFQSSKEDLNCTILSLLPLTYTVKILLGFSTTLTGFSTFTRYYWRNYYYTII